MNQAPSQINPSPVKSNRAQSNQTAPSQIRPRLVKSNCTSTSSAAVAVLMLSMLGCVDDERDESDRLEMQLRAAVEKGQHHPQSHLSQQYCHNNNNKTYTSLSLPLSLFSNGTTMTAAVTAVNVTTTTAAASSATEELRQGCCEENDHYQRLLRMANM